MSTLSPRKGRPSLVVFLALLSLGMWVILIQVVLSHLGVFEPFWFFVIPRINEALASGHWQLVSQTPAWEILIIELSLVLDTPLRELLFLPIGGLLLPFAVYALSRRLTISRLAALLLVAYIALVMSRGAAAYATFAHAWAYPLLFVFFLAFVRIAQKSSAQKAWISVLILLFVALHLFYYSAELLALLFVIGFAASATVFRSASTSSSPQVHVPKTLAVAFLVMFLAFNQMMYDGFIARLSQLSTGGSLSWIYARIASILGLSPTVGESFRLLSSQNVFADLITLALIILIVAPLVFFLIASVRWFLGAHRNSFPAPKLQTVVIWSLVFLTS